MCFHLGNNPTMVSIMFTVQTNKHVITKRLKTAFEWDLLAFFKELES